METKKKTAMPLWGMKVKKRLVELNITQRQLAVEIDVNENYLTDILRGRRSGKKYKNKIINRLNLDAESDLS
jgi:transcriptional regulator with XRE-family HTH domain